MSNAQAKVQAKSPFNNGWTKEYYEGIVNNPSETKKSFNNWNNWYGW